jgi:hypothetical protein
MTEKIKPNNQILNLAILTTITVVIWISFDIYFALKQPPANQPSSEQLAPLDPTFDQKIIEGLKKRKTFTSLELENAPEPITFINLAKNKEATSSR